MSEANEIRKLMESISSERPTHFRVDKTISDDMYTYEPGTWWPLGADLFAPGYDNPENMQAWLDEMGRDDVNVEYATFDDPEEAYPVEDDVTEADIEGELITKDNSTAAGIARDLIAASRELLYKNGVEPSKYNTMEQAETLAGRFYNQILQAIDKELGT